MRRWNGITYIHAKLSCEELASGEILSCSGLGDVQALRESGSSEGDSDEERLHGGKRKLEEL